MSYLPDLKPLKPWRYVEPIKETPKKLKKPETFLLETDVPIDMPKEEFMDKLNSEASTKSVKGYIRKVVSIVPLKKKEVNNEGI
jgi:hypothetical protein